MGTKILFAGAEKLETLQMLKSVNVKYVLMTYMYLRKCHQGTLEKILETAEDFEYVMLDSGAFTFMSAAREKGQTITADAFREYADEYIRFLERYGDWFSVAVELDLYTMRETYRMVEEVRDDLESVFQPIMPIYQGEYAVEKQDYKWFDDMSKRYSYMGIGSGLTAEKNAASNQLFMTARKNNCKIHGMGMTSLQNIRRGFYYTVDSTSWLMGQRFGVTYELRGSMLKTWDKDNKVSCRRRRKHYYESNGLDFQKIMDDDSTEVSRMNALEWAKFTEMVERSKAKDYWDPLEVPRQKKGKNVGDSLDTAPVPLEETVQERLERMAGGSFEEVSLDDLFEVEEGTRIACTDGEDVLWIGVTKKQEQDDSLDCIWMFKIEGNNKVPLKKPEERKWSITREEESRLNEEGREDQFFVSLSTGSGEVPAVYEPGELVDPGNVTALRCDDCYAAGRCPLYEEGAACRLSFKQEVKTPQDLLAATQELVSIELGRVRRQAMFEQLDGGALDKMMSDELGKAMNLIQLFRDLATNQEEITIKAKGSGILQRFFGGGGGQG